MITIIAKFNVKTEKINDFSILAARCANRSRREKGNSSYKVYKCENDDSHFVFIEEWLNDAAVSDHSNSRDFLNFMEEVKPLCTDSPDIQRISLIPASM